MIGTWICICAHLTCHVVISSKHFFRIDLKFHPVLEIRMWQIVSIFQCPLLCARRKITWMSNSGLKTNWRVTRIIARYIIGNVVNWTSSPMTMATQWASLESLLCQPRHGNSSQLYDSISVIRILGVDEEQKRQSTSAIVCVSHFQSSGGAKMIGKYTLSLQNTTLIGLRMSVMRDIYVHISKFLSSVFTI